MKEAKQAKIEKQNTWKEVEKLNKKLQSISAAKNAADSAKSLALNDLKIKEKELNELKSKLGEIGKL